jgi:hypothetical protein
MGTGRRTRRGEFITLSKRKQAAGLVKEGIAVSLAHQIFQEEVIDGRGHLARTVTARATGSSDVMPLPARIMGALSVTSMRSTATWCTTAKGTTADRSNNRIQIFDKDMTYLDSWKHFGRPSGITILKNDTLVVADSESGIRLAGPKALPKATARSSGMWDGSRESESGARRTALSLGSLKARTLREWPRTIRETSLPA